MTLDAITSIASSLGAPRVSDAAFAWTRRHPVQVTRVSDAQALQGCLDLAREHRLVVEPACGAAIAALRAAEAPALAAAADMLVIVCGGVCTPYEDLRRLAERTGVPLA